MILTLTTILTFCEVNGLRAQKSIEFHCVLENHLLINGLDTLDYMQGRESLDIKVNFNDECKWIFLIANNTVHSSELEHPFGWEDFSKSYQSIGNVYFNDYDQTLITRDIRISFIESEFTETTYYPDTGNTVVMRYQIIE